MSISRFTGVQLLFCFVFCLFVSLLLFFLFCFVLFVFLLFFFVFFLGGGVGVFFCSSIPLVLLDDQGISKYLNIFLLSPHLCFIIGFICDLFVARNDSW